MEINIGKIHKMQDTILKWYDQNRRDLPWRDITDPYRIRVSEVMSQQTQIIRVIPKYEDWLQKLPTLQDVALASKHTILSLWSGLGYNNRALRFQEASQIIVDDFGGKVPNNEEDLLGLPGVGPYTAHAILAFAFNQEVPVLDINIKRVLITMLGLAKETKDRDLRDIAIACIPPGESKKRHNALMDYGALVLTSKETGIRSAKQTKFIGSRRRVRGGILKELVKNKIISFETAKQKFPHEQFPSIITQMQKEGLILIGEQNITLQS